MTTTQKWMLYIVIGIIAYYLIYRGYKYNQCKKVTERPTGFQCNFWKS